MKGAIITVIVMIIVAILLAVSSAGEVYIHNNQFDRAIISITEELSSVTLEDVVPFSWDAVYSFAPYTTRQQIEETIGFASDWIEETVSENMVQLFFVRDGRIIASICEYPERLGFNICFDGEIDYGDHILFDISRDDDGIFTLTIHAED